MKRIPKRRRARRGPWRSKPYRIHIASMYCCVCSPETVGEAHKGEVHSQAAHTVNNGMSSKGPDYSCVPLCPKHHDILDRRGTVREWLAQEGLRERLQNIAAQLFAKWEAAKGKAA